MTIPSIIFGIAIAVLLGGAYHFLRGGTNQRMGIYLVVAQVGFWGGHVAAQMFEWTFAMVGPLRVGPGLFGAILLMGLVEALGHIEIPTATEEEE